MAITFHFVSGVRTLELIGLLQSRRRWGGEALAHRLEVSRRTLRREIAALRELGYPVESIPGAGGGYRLSPGGSLPPLLVDDGEAVALVVGLRSAMQSPVAEVEDAAVRALSKVVPLLPARVRRLAEGLDAGPGRPMGEAVTGSEVELDVLVGLASARRDEETVTFRHRGRDGSWSSRRVESHALVQVHSRWYLVAFDLGRHDWRTFRLDRISSVEPDGRKSVPRRIPGDDPTAFVEDGISAAGRPHEVDLTLWTPVERVRAEVGGWGEVEEEEPGRCRLTMRVDSFGWVAFIIGSLDVPYVIHGPPELAEHLRRWAERLSEPTGAR